MEHILIETGAVRDTLLGLVDGFTHALREYDAAILIGLQWFRGMSWRHVYSANALDISTQAVCGHGL